MSQKLRLLKVNVQPVFVIDDGMTLREQAAQVVAVPAEEWRTYPVEGFARAEEALRKQVERPDSSR